ncbi:RINT-1 family protein [Epithele typhae]|uniref:RINT-1 family protein n=1 Tax=Epithele typhae TaxID=378194 RepID=UPI002008CCDB|nr:RINT-1 family protein [Epithele typhae]KAH9912248.1 RINT-1 family protein [Epithele typhae]
MSSAGIRRLLQPPNTQDSDTRALAYLNDTYKSLNDIESGEDLDVMVEQARRELEGIETKLAHSQACTEAVIAQTREQASAQLHTAQELALLRHSLADELTFLSGELVSDLSQREHGDVEGPTLLEDLEALHRSLKELESVKGYVQVVEHAMKLSEAAVEQVRTAGTATVSEYQKLQEFVKSVAAACEKVETVASQPDLHILGFLDNVVEQTWRDMKGVLMTTLLEVAEKLKWPTKVDYSAASSEDRRAFETAFYNLLKLQTIGAKIRDSSKHNGKEGLYPIQALVQAILQRFKFHFEGTRPTNRMDKPEWYFTHIANESHEHRPFMESIVQSLLSSTEYRTINAWREFTNLLLPVLERKIRRTIPALLSHPSILAHTIYQALSFDTAIRDEGFGIQGTTAATGKDGTDAWRGISEIILGKKEWLDAWVEGERKFAMDQYFEIISAPDAWLIADDEGEDEAPSWTAGRELRPTNSARRVKSLVEQVTDRYSPLPEYTHRTRFLIVVQLPLLESYLGRISSSLDAFETLSSSLMRAVPGALGAGDGRGGTGNLTSGVEGTQRLCKALVSAKYLAGVMEMWGEDLFFLELWEEINRRAALRTKAGTVALLPNPNGSESDLPEGTIFEELIRLYSATTGRAEDMVAGSVTSEIESGLRPHLQGGATQQPTSEDSDDIALAQTLLAPLALLSSHLTFLRGTLPRTTVTSLYRRIASRLAMHLLQRQILYRGRARATLHEAKAVLAEAELWVETCRVALKEDRGRVEAPWRPFLQAARLLACEGDTWGKIVDATFAVASDNEWEDVMLDVVGLSEFPREEVQGILRRREDCER